MAERTVTADSPPSLTSAFDSYADNYEEACHRGLLLTGDSREFFARARVRITAECCRGARAVEHVLDFGCGVGHAAPILQEAFPKATILGVDNSSHSIARATERYGTGRMRFSTMLTAVNHATFDLVYCNGVFHHIQPPHRRGQVQQIRDCLAPGGLFALWENNPWNPGTRLVMSRIPFDRDAVTLSYREAQRLLRSAGFRILNTSFHFVFPACLRGMRIFERVFQSVPLGAQYCVLAQKPALGAC